MRGCIVGRRWKAQANSKRAEEKMLKGWSLGHGTAHAGGSIWHASCVSNIFGSSIGWNQAQTARHAVWLFAVMVTLVSTRMLLSSLALPGPCLLNFAELPTERCMSAKLGVSVATFYFLWDDESQVTSHNSRGVCFCHRKWMMLLLPDAMGWHSTPSFMWKTRRTVFLGSWLCMLSTKR